MPAINREPRLAYEEARRIFRYNSKTGHLIYRIAIPYGAWVKPGDRAGCVHHKGYRIVRVNGVNYMEHRVCWLLHYGEWPEEEIDHKDKNKANNRIKNLRDATREQNAANRGLFASNKTGYIGVYLGEDGYYHAGYKHKGKRFRLGRFRSPVAAARAYNRAARKVWGKFASLNDVPRRKVTM